jgi:hypothetical protein
MIACAERERMYGRGDLTGTLTTGNWSFASFVLQHPEHRVVQKD